MIAKVKRQKAKGKTTIQKSKLPTLLTLALWFCLLSFDFCLRAVEACPGCKEAFFEPGKIAQNLSTARGYALSVMLMLAVPMLLIGGITTLILRARRRSPRSGIDTPKLSR